MVHDSLEGAACAPEVVDDAVLLVSELVTNAVVHAQTPMDVSVHIEQKKVRVEVRDDSDALPVVRLPRDEVATGRGMELLERIARAWGIERRTPGKVVWFELGLCTH